MLRTFVSTGTFCQRLKCSRTRHNLKAQVQSSAIYLQIAMHFASYLPRTIGHRCGLESWSTYYYLQSYRRCLFRNLGRSIRSPGCHKIGSAAAMQACRWGKMAGPRERTTAKAGRGRVASAAQQADERTRRSARNLRVWLVSVRHPTCPSLTCSLLSNQPIISAYIVLTPSRRWIRTDNQI